MSFAQAGIAVNEEWIVSITEGLAYCDTARMCKAVARSNNEIFEGVIGMKVQARPVVRSRSGRFFPVVDTKIYSDKMPRYLLCGRCKSAFAFASHELHSGIIRTADLKRSTPEVHHR